MSAEFEIKDKYTIEDLVSIVKVLRAPAVARGTVPKLMTQLKRISLRKPMRLLRR